MNTTKNQLTLEQQMEIRRMIREITKLNERINTYEQEFRKIGEWIRIQKEKNKT